MSKRPSSEYPHMTAVQQREFQQAVAEEVVAKNENIEAAKTSLPRIEAACKHAVELVEQLRTAREAAGVSLSEMQQRTGIRKSALSRLENSKAPNPTLATLQRYAEAIGKELVLSVGDRGE